MVNDARPRRVIPVIDLNRCTGCGWCVPSCPLHLLVLEPRGWTKHSALTSTRDCTGCGRCAPVCPFKAITLQRDPDTC